MSRIAIISDIHSNWHALQAVLERIDALGCDDVLCLGDVVGYGAHPVECFDLILDRGWTWIQGNHDALVGDPDQSLSFNAPSLEAVRHNHGLLSEEQRRHLDELPWRLEPEEGLYLAHGSFRDRDRYLMYRPDFESEARYLLERGGPGVCFFGHTHHPVFCDAAGFVPLTGEPLRPDPAEVVLINPGSVGQPRDRDPRSSFSVWDREAGTVLFERVKYDIEGARNAIQEAGLPAFLGDRLREGR